MLSIRKALPFAALAALSTAAPAAPYVYTITATATGALDGTSYTNALVTLTATADTANVLGGGGVFIVPATVTVSVAGVGADAFTGPFDVFDNQNTLIGGLDQTDGTGDVLDTVDPAFGTYDLRSPIGPVTGGAIYEFGTGFATTRGLFHIDAATTSTFTASPQAVPEPSAFAALGVGALAVFRRRKRV